MSSAQGDGGAAVCGRYLGTDAPAQYCTGDSLRYGQTRSLGKPCARFIIMEHSFHLAEEQRSLSEGLEASTTGFMALTAPQYLAVVSR